MAPCGWLPRGQLRLTAAGTADTRSLVASVEPTREAWWHLWSQHEKLGGVCGGVCSHVQPPSFSIHSTHSTHSTHGAAMVCNRRPATGRRLPPLALLVVVLLLLLGLAVEYPRDCCA